MANLIESDARKNPTMPSGSFAVSIAILERLIASRIQACSYWIMAIYMTNDPLVLPAIEEGGMAPTPSAFFPSWVRITC